MNSRRNFIKKTAAAAAVVSVAPISNVINSNKNLIRLGGPVFDEYNDPDEWIRALKSMNYTAAYCPVGLDATNDEIRAYRKAAGDAGIIISEVGAWSNPISPDEKQRQEAIEKCIRGLQVADEIGARCCVNISGSRNREKWAGPHMENLTDETFDMVVEVTRKVIDAVNPTQTFFTLEAMPWAFPHTPDAYVRLLKAIDRERFAVHLDPMNMVVSPEVYFNNGAMIKECFTKLGPYIRSCHAKDIILNDEIYTPSLKELRPGLGKLDYHVFLTELYKLDNVPMMMEHLETAEEYKLAAGYIRSVAGELNINI